MSGIYIHIPYCRQKCNYCNFYSLATSRYRNELVLAIIREIELRKDYLADKTVNTIFFGGGTPSLLYEEELRIILDKVSSHFYIATDAEITLEANPEDLTTDKLTSFKNLGVNRLSIGIQSFNERDLMFLNRSHTGKQSQECIRRAKETGFTNLSIDLIYGIPNLDDEQWQFNLMQAVELEIPHISAYALTVEEKTPMAVMIQKGKIPAPEDWLQLNHFNLMVDLLESKGYQHYEISNFSLPGMHARHNTSYWKGIPYLGIGPSAHSYDGNSRQWNISNLGQYIHSLETKTLPFEKEILTKTQKFNEYVMTSLRTQWGCDLESITSVFGLEWTNQVLIDAEKYIRQGDLKRDGSILVLTKQGKFKADGVASALFRLPSPEE